MGRYTLSCGFLMDFITSREQPCGALLSYIILFSMGRFDYGMGCKLERGGVRGAVGIIGCFCGRVSYITFILRYKLIRFSVLNSAPEQVLPV